MRRMLKILQKLPAGEIDPRNLARLEDRIRMYEGLPQRYGTQFDWDDDGKLSPVLHDPVAEVDRRRRELGMECSRRRPNTSGKIRSSHRTRRFSNAIDRDIANGLSGPAGDIARRMAH